MGLERDSKRIHPDPSDRMARQVEAAKLTNDPIRYAKPSLLMGWP
jgi:hypothetical protein